MSSWTHKLVMCDFPHFDAIGGLYQGKGRFVIPPPEEHRSWCLVDRSKQVVYYYWRRGSESLIKLLAACDKHGFVTDAPSWSRLSRFIWEKEISPLPSTIKPHPYAVQLAKDKRHWHYTKCVPGIYMSITEIDIKSAYAQSFANQPSIWMESPLKVIDDKGAMQRWQALYPYLDKQVRLSMIGCLSGYEFQTLTPGASPQVPLKRGVVRKVYDGGVFNTIHIALFKLYKLLKQVEAIAPEFIPRVHTDSFWVDARIPTDKLNMMLNIIKTNGFRLTVKGHGQSHLYDLNSGVIGGRLIGIPQKVLPMFDLDAIQYPDLTTYVEPLDKRFAHLEYHNERFTVGKIRAIMKLTGRTLLY